MPRTNGGTRRTVAARSGRRLRGWVLGGWSLGGALLCGVPGGAELAAQELKPNGVEEINRLSATLKHGKGRGVKFRDADGNEHVADVLGEDRSRLLLMTPDGRLQSLFTVQTRSAFGFRKPWTPQQLADQLTSGPFKGWKSHIHKRYAFVYECSEEFLARARRIVEETDRLTADYFAERGFTLTSDGNSLPVVIYATEEKYRKETKVAEGIMAFYSLAENRTVMFETPTKGTIAPKMAARQVLNTVAHETVHQSMAAWGLQKRTGRWPFWLTEGFPEYISPSVHVAGGASLAYGEPNHGRLFTLRSLEASPRDLQHTADTLLTASEIGGARYAVAWAYLHYLAQRRSKDLRAYVREVMTGPELALFTERGAGDRTADEALFVKHFGRRPGELLPPVLTHVHGLNYRDPSADDPRIVVAIEYVRNGRTQRNALHMLNAANIPQAKSMLLKEVPAAARPAAVFRIQEFFGKRDAEQFALDWVNGSGAIVIE